MTSKERVKKAIHFNNPDRIPIRHVFTSRAIMNFGGEKFQEISRKYPSDVGYSQEIDLSLSLLSPRERLGRYKDEWGCVWENLCEGDVGQVKEHPLADWENLKDYKFPEPTEVFDFDAEKKKFKDYNDNRFILKGGHLFFEMMQYLRGYENFMLDLIEKSKELSKLAEGIFEYNVKSIKEWLKLPVDGIAFADDWGTQSGLMISPSLWRDFFKPYYKEMFSMVHKEGRDVFFHSDGYTMEIIPDLIEIGVDILNPQFSCHNLEELGKITAGKVCICSDIDRQYLLPFGTPEEIEENVKEVIRIFGNKGGLIGMAAIGGDVPLENAEAAYRAFYKYGIYR